MNEFIQVPITVAADSIKWDEIELFRRRFDALWANYKALKLTRLPGNFTRQDDGRYTGGFDLPDEHRLKGLYVDFRHFYLNNEPTNFERFANYLATLSTVDDFRWFLKEEKQRMRSPFIEANRWFEYEGVGLTTKKWLDVWFNAELFHNDPEKQKTLQKWNQVYSDRTAKSMLFMAVRDCILVIRNVNWVMLDLSRDNLKLRMPMSVVPVSKRDGAPYGIA